MKCRLVVLGIILFMIQALSLNAIDISKHFGGIKFGDSKNSIDKTLDGDSLNTKSKSNKRTSQEKINKPNSIIVTSGEFDGCAVDNTEYEFCNNKLATIKVKLQNVKDFKKIHNQLTSQYGKANSYNDTLGVGVWYLPTQENYEYKIEAVIQNGVLEINYVSVKDIYNK